MAIKKSRANHYYNDTDYDTLHYETQTEQVKVSGSDSNIDELLLKGKLLNGVDLNTVKETGVYRIINCTNVPTNNSSTLIMVVHAVEEGIVSQEVFDHNSQDSYKRYIDGTTIKSWTNAGQSLLMEIDMIKSQLGDTGDLSTGNTPVDAINTLKQDVDSHDVKIQDNAVEIDRLDNEMNIHNHDSRYFKLSGGNLSGKLSVPNSASLAGRSNSGVDVNIGKVDDNNYVVLGSSGYDTVVEGRNGWLFTSDGFNVYQVFSEGNMGHGSGLDADTLDGVHLSKIIRKDTTNYYEHDQVFTRGKRLLLRAESGSSTAGQIVFEDGSGNRKAMISPQADGAVKLYTGGSAMGTKFNADGTIDFYEDHYHNTNGGTTRSIFKNGADSGIGFYMNNAGTYAMYDWNASRTVFSVDRDDNVVQFSGAISTQGKRLFIQYTEPSNAQDGDVWINL